MNEKRKYKIQGTVSSKRDGRGVPNLKVEAWDKDLVIDDLLGSAKTDENGRFTLSFDETYYQEICVDRKPDIYFKVFYEGKLIKSTEDSVLWNVDAGDSKITIEADVPCNSNLTSSFAVEGKVASRFRAGVGGLRIEIVDKNVGKDQRVAEAVTDNNGNYRTTFEIADLQKHGKQRPDMQARVFAGKKFLGASEVCYNASERETLNVLLTEKADSALPSEYETLTGTLFAHFKGNLGDLKETGDRQDVTYLANKTGWDARAVALAALADQFSKRTEGGEGGGIEPGVFYALFRAGLPANESALYQADTKTVERILNQGIDQGVVPVALRESLPGVLERFEKLAASHALDGPALAGASSLKQMLTVSLGEDQERQKQFAELHTRYRSDPEQLWKTVRDAFGDMAAKRLDLDGKLGYLTFNNAPLILKLHEAANQDRMTDTMDLVHGGYYRADKWKPLIGNDPVPPEITGESDEEKRERYAELLAAQVRLSFPTAVVAQMVNSGETPLLSAGRKEKVHAFLSVHQGNFEIGMQPVEQYIARNDIQVDPEVTKEVKRIQRVYQITPSDGAMNVLLNKGLDSAYAVVRYDQDEFIKSFKNDLDDEADAKLIYIKSQQVHNAVLNIATSFLTASNAPAIGVHSPAGILDPIPQPPANAADVIAYSTLEELLGEMDYCSCKHCRSILSPAAYLVDLLLFCDRPTNEIENPLDVLLSRRPDIEHLPLTCENTNTPLPYIDLVNETLEYFIANDTRLLSLEDYTGHNTTNEATPEELLANPQFVRDTAYTTLAGTHFPPPLPFHQPLENLRRYFDKFETPLPELMEALRKDDQLEPANAKEYGWRDILMEELHLSRAEYELLTDGNLTLQQLYGYDPATSDPDVLSKLSKAKPFTRRIGITYEEIIEILKARFVNPNSTLIPKIERLGVSFATLKRFKNGDISDVEFINMLSPGIDELLHLYGGDIKAWVRDEENYKKIMALITVTNPTAELIRRLEEIGIPFAKLKELKDGILTDAQFDSLLPAGFDVSQYGDDVKQWIRDNLMEAGDFCSFDKLQFRYTDPDKINESIRAFEFVRLIRFIRLWKKLGWTIEQTDKAITALYPANPIPNNPNASDEEKLDAGFSAMLPRLGVIKRVMATLKLKPKKDLLSLLACFAPIDTHGAASLYRQMFGSQALLEQDPAFADNGYGEFLTDNTQKLLAHIEVIRGTFQLTEDEFAQITAALGFDVNKVSVPYIHTADTLEQHILDVAPGIAYDNINHQLSFTGVLSEVIRNKLKTLANVSVEFKQVVDDLYTANQATLTSLTLDAISALYCRGWLARKLKLSVLEFLLLAQFTGLDPFAAPDAPNPPILALIKLVTSLRTTSLKPVEALYLIWNQDISEKSAPDENTITGFARTLRSDFTAIEAEFALAADPDGNIARDKMVLVYGNEATDLFFGLLNNSFVTEVEYSHDQATLEQSILDAAPGCIAYDDFRKRLAYTGVLTKDTCDALKVEVLAAFETAVDELYAENHKIIGPFFAQYPELRPLYEAYFFFGQLVSSAAYTHAGTALEKAILDAAADRIAYDNVGHHLIFTGVMTTDTRDALKAVNVNGLPVSQDFKNAVDNLYTKNRTAIREFFTLYPVLSSQEDAYLTANDSEERRRSVLLASFLPELKRRRKRQQALQSVNVAAKADATFASVLLDDVAVLHAVADNAQPALDDLTVIGTPGLSAQFFFSNTVPDPVPVPADQSSNSEADLAYSAAGDNKLPPNGNNPANAISGIWNGYLEAPENNFYNLRIKADAGATVTLLLDSANKPFERKIVFKDGGGTETWTLDGQKVAETQDGNIWSNDASIELRTGTLYSVELKVENVKDTLSVQWQTTGRGWEVIPSRYLYSASLMNHLHTVYLRFLKSTSLATNLRLSAGEIAYLAVNSDYQVGGQAWLNSLPATGSPDKATSTDLFKVFGALLDYARIKADLAPDDERLITVLNDPATATQNPDSLLFTIAQWKSDSLDALLTRFGKTVNDIAHLETFRRIYDAYLLVKKLRIPATALLNAATNETTGDTVRDLQGALRARYDASGWLDVLKPINDEMRSVQRDALIAYILHQMRANPASEHIDTPDKLFEYFLMDVQMDPCMHTSRIRHALSSVQLFIERCLMNLEPRVASSSINAKQWQWMSRYRVWEANRKVFLYPENWLEPELRDDQSPFFKETMSELLQSDITEDSAATALLNYLSKLEEVAKLEPCGIHYVENEPGTSDDITHVVARTAGANRKYFYRRLEYDWTPWEQIKLDIEDNPVVPVVWKDRLFLFWLRILKEGPMTGEKPFTKEGELISLSTSDIKTDAPKVAVQAVLCWSEYFNNKWQPIKTSDVNRATNLGDFDPTGQSAFDRSALRLSVSKEQGALRITISDQGRSSFLLYNTHSLPVRREDENTVLMVRWSFGCERDLGTSSDTFTITYDKMVPVLEGGWQVSTLTRPLLKNQIYDRTIQPRHPLQNVWDAPFFYEDSRHVFYVTTAEEIVQIPEWNNYGIAVKPGYKKKDTPPLVVKEDPRLQAELDKRKDIPLGRDPGVVDPSPIERFVSEDAYIDTAIGTTGTVHYDEVEIGLTGRHNGIHRQ